MEITYSKKIKLHTTHQVKLFLYIESNETRKKFESYDGNKKKVVKTLI